MAKVSTIGDDYLKHEFHVRGYLFQNNFVSKYEMYVNNDKMFLQEYEEKSNFSTDSNLIKWYDNNKRWINELNRNNLVLKWYPLCLGIGSCIRPDAKALKTYTDTYQCSVHSKNEFWSKLKSLKKSLQKKITNKLKDKN